MTQDAFDILDEMYELIPQANLEDGTYKWVCNYAGMKFYTRVDSEDMIWLNDGI